MLFAGGARVILITSPNPEVGQTQAFDTDRAAVFVPASKWDTA